MLIQKQKIKALFLYALLKEIVSNKASKTTCKYDLNGNLKTDVGCSMLAPLEVEPLTVIDDSEKYRKKYLWDAENRLMAVETTRKNDDTTKYIVSFAYNGDGQRIYKALSINKAGVSTPYSQILYVRNSFGETIEEHSLDLTSSIYHLSSSYVFGNGKRIMSITSEDTKTYYLSDILGSNSLLVDNNGNPVQLTKYDEFGNIYYQYEKSGKIKNNYNYTGKLLDKETGLYYYGARYYNPEWGRWVSKDAFKGYKTNSQNANRYSYALNNPLFFYDPDGNFVAGVQWQYTIMAGIGGGSFTIGVVTDFKGNYGLMITGAAGFGAGVNISLALIGLIVSNVPTIWDLEGTSMVYGGSVGKGFGVTIEAGQITDFQASDEPNDWTFDINVSKGGGIELHGFVSATGIISLKKSKAKKISDLILKKLITGEKITAKDLKPIIGDKKFEEFQEKLKLLNEIVETKKEKTKNEKKNQKKKKQTTKN